MVLRILRTSVSLAVAVVAAAGIAVAASAMQHMHAAGPVTVQIAAENGSHQSGSATLVQRGSAVVVTVTMSGIPHGVAEPTHIHPGTCTHLNPTPRYPLANSRDGSTTTTLPNVSLSSLTGGHYAINVHDAQHLARYVACGNIR